MTKLTASICRAAGLASLALMAVVFTMSACKQTSTDNSPLLALLGGSGGAGDPYASAVSPGDVVPISAGAVDFNMIYAGDSAGIIFPTEQSDYGTATLLRNFFIGETEVTNALVAAVFQWAYNHGRLIDNAANPNGVDTTTVKFGGQELINLLSHDRINYTAGAFTVDPGYENHPVTHFKWYGAIMFCNWLTEMTDGSAANVVYTGITDTWVHTDTVADPAKSGYRLPSQTEWMFASRYIGQTAPAIDDLATQYVARSINNGSSSLTAGYYWTPGDYASGATDDLGNAAATDAVAWYNTNSGGALQQTAQLAANQLGIHDMSGNVLEWCFDMYGPVERMQMSGGYSDIISMMRVSYWNATPPDNLDHRYGMRLARTRPITSDVAVTGISLNKSTAVVGIGTTDQLTATVTPSGASHPGVIWASDNPTLASVDSTGVVTGVAAGTTTIRATTEDNGLTATCTVTVMDFSSAVNPGETVPVIAGAVTFNMKYANNTTSITFPNNLDNGVATLTQEFFMGETEVTNALVREVFQWAYGSGKFSDIVTNPNGINETTAKHGGRELLNLDSGGRISYNAGVFSVETGHENNPALAITWYGAIMFCNWLTEMKDGGTANVVYSGIDTDWLDDETVATTTNTGYRLPTAAEWCFAAKYIGQTLPTVEDLASECVSQGVNNGSASLTPGYYWTPAGYASGATKDDTNPAETGAVAWYSDNSGGSVHAVAGLSPNQLGIYDMSGNINEWLFDESGTNRYARGGYYGSGAAFINLYQMSTADAGTTPSDVGFRIAKSQ